MESILPELVAVIVGYLPEVEKAFLSLTSKYFKRIIRRKYSLLASCVIDNSRVLELVESWGNNWNKYECMVLESSPFYTIFREREEFNIEQTEWVGYSVAYSNNPLVAEFSHAVDTSSMVEIRKAYYRAIARGAVDSDSLQIIDTLPEDNAIRRYLQEYAAEKHNIEAFLYYQVIVVLSAETKAWLRGQSEQIKQRLNFLYRLQIQ